MYIDTNTVEKEVKGGFAIGGFGTAKGGNASFFNVATETTGIINPAQNKILWYPLKNAFLAGKVLIEKPDSVGTNSTATGYESKAIGNWSQALGYKTIARRDYSTAIGKNAIASGWGSLAMGCKTIASGWSSFSSGFATIAQHQRG